MNVAGIDVSKGKSTVFILRPIGEAAAKPFEVPHASSKLEDSVKLLKSLEGETTAVMEHTGRHHEPVALYLSSAGIFVSAVNPKRIKDQGWNAEMGRFCQDFLAFRLCTGISLVTLTECYPKWCRGTSITSAVIRLPKFMLTPRIESLFC